MSVQHQVRTFAFNSMQHSTKLLLCHKNSALSNYRIGWHIQKQKDAKSLLVTRKKVSLFLVQTVEEQFLQMLGLFVRICSPVNDLIHVQKF